MEEKKRKEKKERADEEGYRKEGKGGGKETAKVNKKTGVGRVKNKNNMETQKCHRCGVTRGMKTS